MISRYEEYLPFEGDRYGRFPAALSLAARQGFLEKPVVEVLLTNVWLNSSISILRRV